MLGNAQDTVYGDPGYYSSMEYIAPGVTQIIASNQMPGEDWVSVLARTVGAINTTIQQRQLLEENMRRARLGLPPLDIAAYTGMGVNVGLSEGTKQLLLYGGGALALVWLSTSLFKHR